MLKMLTKASILPAKKDFSLQRTILADSCHRNSISHSVLLAGGARGSNAFTVIFTILQIIYHVEISAEI